MPLSARQSPRLADSTFEPARTPASRIQTQLELCGDQSDRVHSSASGGPPNPSNLPTHFQPDTFKKSRLQHPGLEDYHQLRTYYCVHDHHPSPSPDEFQPNLGQTRLEPARENPLRFLMDLFCGQDLRSSWAGPQRLEARLFQSLTARLF